MKHIFYLIAIGFIISEFLWILDPIGKTLKNMNFHKLKNDHKDQEWDDYSDEYKKAIKSYSWGVIFFIWLFVGLFTFNWIAFLLIIVFNLLIIAPISRLTRFSSFYTGLHWVNSAIGVLFGLFVIVNSYHLQIDLYELLKQWYANR